MIDIPRLIADFEGCIGWPYASPGSNDERGIDCSGMFVRAFRLQGESIYHGSNTIWRRHLADRGEITGTADLRPGMAVFKWKPETPAKFHDSLGDFCHIGLVTSVDPLRIIHASTEGMRVRADSRIGKWRYWGVLAAADMPEEQPTLRRGSRSESVKRLQEALISCGFTLAADGIFGPVTERCVRAFQRKRGLDPDGVAGPLTWAALGGDGDE